MANEKRGIGARADREETPEPAEKRTIGRRAPKEKQAARPAANKSAGKLPPAAQRDGGGERSRGAGRASTAGPTSGEPSLGELAGLASRRLGALFSEAKEKAGPAARRVGALFDEAKVKAGPTARSAAEATKRVAVDLEKGLDEAFGEISAQARDLMAKGQHTRVRISFLGRQLTELPIAVVAAAEAASLWWFGPLRLLLGHVVGKSVLDVEFVSNADAHVAEGKAQLADGELDKALAAFDKALSMDRRSAGAWLGRGVALKLRGDRPAAREAFEKAESCDPHGDAGREARRHLDNLAGK